MSTRTTAAERKAGPVGRPRSWRRRWTAGGLVCAGVTTALVGLARPASAATVQSLPGSIDCGYEHSLLVTQPDAAGNNEVYSVGSNYYGELGDGTLEPRALFAKIPGLTRVKAVAAGRGTSLALKADGTVWAWGAGPLGNAAHVDAAAYGESKVPVQVTGITNAVAIDVGDGFALAALADGTVKAWGKNAYGQLGNGTTTDAPTPITVPGLTGVGNGHGDVAAGQSHSLAVLANGTVKTWGNGEAGQLGTGNTNSSLVPVTVPGLTNVDFAESRVSHNLVRLSNRTVKAWGVNYLGALGDGTDVQFRESPVTVTNPGGTASVVALASGVLSSMSSKVPGPFGFGEVRAWGVMGGYRNVLAFPYRPSGQSNAIAMCDQGIDALVVNADGSLWVLGDNYSGQLGVGDTTARSSFVQATKTW
ncbi:RCC1 domain-containing protein [Thermomonospora umbrina]|uniref:Alpha-tubulin suppressor-like RCC1 family protein n=1 Tax=Thermomonospora umbrina TaxID=111806 RepID=A0A3D9SPF0_9ACTN|nr:hypothetical protein [Thermomonospora umbrina]REE97788.1 alpha-tubulin suppressor-like RCC1 family protein [Thermomonospora umbrina]